MSICVSVKVAEGLVLAADSAVVLEGLYETPQGKLPGIVQTFQYANKVTQFKDYPIGVLTWGLGSIGPRSIQSLILEYAYQHQPIKENQKFLVETIATKLINFVKERYGQLYASNPSKPLLGFLIGGFSYGEFFADQFFYEFPQSQAPTAFRTSLPNGNQDFGVNWFGQTDALVRLIKGFDPVALQGLIKRGVDPAIIQEWINSGEAELPLPFDGMPLQDAIDFANYAIQVVIGRFRFGSGAPLCGGDIDIAVITPTSFRWAQKKKWSLNETGEDLWLTKRS